MKSFLENRTPEVLRHNDEHTNEGDGISGQSLCNEIGVLSDGYNKDRLRG